MIRKIFYALVIFLLLSACGSQQYADDSADTHGSKNPKDAKVSIENKVVTIKIPGHTTYFWVEKVSDDSVQYDKLYFKYDTVEGKFFYQTNLADWQAVVLKDNSVEMGQVKVVFAPKEITISYPSGTWAFP